jgi:ubiquinol-cytochrome c reductase cytochrome c subunit
VKRGLPHALVAVAAVVLGIVLAPRMATGAPKQEALTGQVPSGPSANDPRVIYLRDCAVCHGADAAGTVYGPSLQGVGAAAVDYWVSTGRMPLLQGLDRPAKSPVQQPRPGQQLPDTFALIRRHPPLYPPDVIAGLVSYVASITGPGPGIPQVDLAAASLPRGGELYREQCAACHAWGGDGGALLNIQAPALHSATSVQVAEAVRVGPDNMPAFGTAAISPEDLNSVVAYVKYLNHPSNRGGHPLWHLGPVAEGGVAWILGMGILLVTVRWIGDRG